MLKHRINTHKVQGPLSRRNFLSCSAVIAAVAVATPAQAFQHDSILVPGRIPARAGVTPWDNLEKVNFNGFTKPATLAPEAAALVGQRITIEGYTMAFEEGEQSQEFLLSAYNSHCPYCSPGSMASNITVHTNQPVRMKAGTLTVSGTLMVDKTDLSGMIYHLTDAKIV